MEEFYLLLDTEGIPPEELAWFLVRKRDGVVMAIGHNFILKENTTGSVYFLLTKG